MTCDFSFIWPQIEKWFGPILYNIAYLPKCCCFDTVIVLMNFAIVPHFQADQNKYSNEKSSLEIFIWLETRLKRLSIQFPRLTTNYQTEKSKAGPKRFALAQPLKTRQIMTEYYYRKEFFIHLTSFFLTYVLANLEQ